MKRSVFAFMSDFFNFSWQHFVVFHVQDFHLLKFLLSNCILCDPIMHGIVFFIYFSDCILLVYRNTADFCVLGMIFNKC